MTWPENTPDGVRRAFEIVMEEELTKLANSIKLVMPSAEVEGLVVE